MISSACFRSWERQARYEFKQIAKLMNVQGNDVVALMKLFQLSPFFIYNLKYTIDMKNRNHGILTVTHCRTLEALEKEGGEERIKMQCGKVEPFIFKQYAEFLNPKMELKPLKIPPRQSKQDICCQWEYRVKMKGTD